MKAVLFATRALPELAPLTEGSCDALLSVACKPLIVHNLEALAMAGLTSVIIVVSPNAYAVEAVLGDGTRWGMHFEYVLATAGETEQRTLGRISHRLGDEFIAMRGEMLRTPLVAEFLERAHKMEAGSVIATIGGVEAGLRLIRNGPSGGGLIAERGCAGVRDYIDFPAARVALIDSLGDFHRANLEVLDGAFAGLIVPGREIAPKVRVGRHSRVSRQACKEARVLIGARCRVAKDAEFAGRVLVSDDVVIDSRAILRDAVIMPNTYVGELVEVDNAIVAGNRLIHIDLATVAVVPDSFLLASIRATGLWDRMRSGIDRILGVILLAASIWLWPIALLTALAKNPRQPVSSRTLVGNRKLLSRGSLFKAFEFKTVIPILRYLPYVLRVIAGDLALVGVEPLEASDSIARIEEWELLRDKGRVGLIGPVQLTSGFEMPNEERRIIEAGYVATASLTEDFKWILRGIAALASRRAWLPIKRRPRYAETIAPPLRRAAEYTDGSVQNSTPSSLSAGLPPGARQSSLVHKSA